MKAKFQKGGEGREPWVRCAFVQDQARALYTRDGR